MIKPTPRRKLTDEERAVWNAIKKHKRGNPFRFGATQRFTFEGQYRMRTRHLRRVISDLVDAGYPVCSTSKTPAGYFVPRNEAEIRECQKTFQFRYVRAIMRRVRGLDRILQGQKQRRLKI